jgi:hypothetical protein
MDFRERKQPAKRFDVTAADTRAVGARATKGLAQSRALRQFVSHQLDQCGLFADPLLLPGRFDVPIAVLDDDPGEVVELFTLPVVLPGGLLIPVPMPVVLPPVPAVPWPMATPAPGPGPAPAAPPLEPPAPAANASELDNIMAVAKPIVASFFM